MFNIVHTSTILLLVCGIFDKAVLSAYSRYSRWRHT